ncbi:AraC family transcriptional regulator [Vibrio cholerae]|nr:helix-turn-helix domain-containing protein [Vibrio cholerae]EGR0612148.1 AraC family transcriptional regulator [Vibrio cholerae]NOF78944.1 AraC family transcriptional regulator [Vibrio cholerae]NOF79949.1 AraC family transcriptional regulator [Vibrio cholerae]
MVPMDTVNYRPSAYPAISLIEADYRQFAFERHYHLDIHIGLITQGVQRFYHQGAWHQVGQGSVVLMSPDELHDGHAHSNTGYQVQVFSIEPEWLQQTLEANQIEQVIGFEQLIVQDPTLFHSLQQLHHLLRQDNLSQLAKDCLPYQGFAPLLERYSYLKQPTVKPLGQHNLALLKEWVLSQLDQPIRLEQLAQLCQLSPTQFQRHFKAQTGLTPYAWLRRLRLEQAMKLLQSGKPGTDVAYQVGFYDQAHFSKAFKATYGLSPSLITRFS